MNCLTEAVLMSTHNLCFEQKYENYQSFLSENFQFLEVKFSIYFNRHVFVMLSGAMTKCSCMIWPAPVTYLKYTYFQNVN